MSQLMIHTIIEPPSESFSLECNTTKPFLRSFRKPAVKMLSVFFCLVFVLFASLIPDAQGHCRTLRFTIDPIHGCRLENHVIRTIDIINEDICQLQCYLEPNCVSYNFNKKEESNGQHKCDLNNVTYKRDNEHSGDLAKSENYVYREAENACARKPCQNNATCQAGFTDRDYQCLCIPGFTGHDCEHDIDECVTKEQINCDDNAYCENTPGSYKCRCQQGFHGDGKICTEKPRFLIICEKKRGKITCQNGKKISILDANYGRLDRYTCLHHAMSNINCRSSNSLQIVRGKCNGKTECQLHAVNNELGGDPCGGTHKYLEVKYRCPEL